MLKNIFLSHVQNIRATVAQFSIPLPSKRSQISHDKSILLKINGSTIAFMIINILLNGPWHSWIELALYPPDKIWLLFMTDNLSRGKNVKFLFVRWIRNCWLNRKIRLIFCMIYRKASTKKRVFHLWVVKCRAISKHITLLLKRNTFLWTINPLDGSICVYTIHVRFRKVVYWFCLCSPFCVQKWKKSHKNRTKIFIFTAAKQSQWAVSCFTKAPQIDS